MRWFPIIILFALLFAGCAQQEQQKIDFKLSYMLIERENNITEGPLSDNGTISFPRHSIYFHLRANITSKDSISHYLKVLDQTQGMYTARLPLYSRETVNGAPRSWEDITGLALGQESLMTLSPGVETPIDQPIFFFNQEKSPKLPSEIELKVSIVNASGATLGTTAVRIKITESGQ